MASTSALEAAPEGSQECVAGQQHWASTGQDGKHLGTELARQTQTCLALGRDKGRILGLKAWRAPAGRELQAPSPQHTRHHPGLPAAVEGFAVSLNILFRSFKNREQRTMDPVHRAAPNFKNR